MISHTATSKILTGIILWSAAGQGGQPERSEGSQQRYLVLYLLLGLMLNDTVWRGDRLGELMMVMPDAATSWFVNQASSGDRQFKSPGGPAD